MCVSHICLISVNNYATNSYGVHLYLKKNNSNENMLG